MPYAFLVAALGAIVSSAIALFAFRSWSAMTVAPAAGAVLGFVIGVATLRLRALPLGASMEEYKAAGKGGSLEAGAPLYFWASLNFALVISTIEAPILFISKASAPIVFPAAWIAIAAWSFYRVWRLNTESALSNDLDIFKLVGGSCVIGMAGGVMYLAYMMLFSPAADDPLTLIKWEFIANQVAAVGAAAIAVLGTGLISLLAELINSQRYQ